MSDDGNFWTGVFVTAVLAGSLYYCTREDPAPKQYVQPREALAMDAAAGAATYTPPAPPPQIAPSHNYNEKDGATYYYVSGVSEDERKAGKSGGFVSRYQYGGKDGNGGHIIFGAGLRYTCSNPCKIIKASDGTLFEYNERSVISAVFQDAMRGFLRTAPKPKPQPIIQEPWEGYKSDPIAPESSGGSSAGQPQGDGVPTGESVDTSQ